MWWFRKKDNVEKWIAKLKKRNPESRQKAVEALGNLKDTRAVEPLIRILEQDVSFVRWEAAEALGKIGDASAIKPLINALVETWYIQRKAEDALVRIGSPAVEPLIRALEKEKVPVRCEVAKVLAKVGDRQAVEPLIKALEDENSRVRATAAEALGKIGDLRAAKPLSKVLGDGNGYVRIS